MKNGYDFKVLLILFFVPLIPEITEVKNCERDYTTVFKKFCCFFFSSVVEKMYVLGAKKNCYDCNEVGKNNWIFLVQIMPYDIFTMPLILLRFKIIIYRGTIELPVRS